MRGQCVQGCFIRGRIEQGRKSISNRVAQRGKTTETWALSAEREEGEKESETTNWLLPLQTQINFNVINENHGLLKVTARR